MSLDRLSLGEIEIIGLRDGYFHLDGGAMFGVVPKVIWDKMFPADSQNRIQLSLNCFLIRTPEANLVFETGIGTLLNQKLLALYSFDQRPGLVNALRAVGLEPGDIDFVVNSHLHFDHCGGNTCRNERGEIVPTFPRAAYIIQKGEWDTALNPGKPDKLSYRDDSFRPIGASGQLKPVEGCAEIVKGVEAVLVPGHTASHQCLRVCAGGRVVFLLGDLVPTSGHVGLSYIMAYDLFPMDTLKNKKLVFEEGIAGDWIFAFDHDPSHFFGKITCSNDKYAFLPLQ